MPDSFYTPAPYVPEPPDFFPETLHMQGPVNEKWYTQYGGGLAVAFTGYQKGGVTRIRFSEECEITELGVMLNSPHGGSPHYYRLGIYSYSMGEPGALDVDAGTLTINNASTAGMQSLVLAEPYPVGAGQIINLACQCDYTSSYPGLILHANNILYPYNSYGLDGTNYYTSTATAYTLIGSGQSALPDPFTVGSPAVHGHTPAVYVKVAVGV